MTHLAPPFVNLAGGVKRKDAFDHEILQTTEEQDRGRGEPSVCYTMSLS